MRFVPPLGPLGAVNRWFGGVCTSRKMIERVARATGQKRFSILEVASGSGEVPKLIQKNLAHRGITLDVTLLDLAQSHLPGENRRVVGDGLALPFCDGAFDLASCNLFAHHLKPDQLQQFVREGLRVSRRALLINDLVRHPLHLALAYAGYPVMPSRIAWLDGLTSVRRSYVPEEMREMIVSATASEGVPSTRNLNVLFVPHGSDGLEKQKNRTAFLAHDQHFPNIVPGQKEFDGSKIAEKIFDVPVVEHALQLEAIRNGSMHRPGRPPAGFPAQNNFLHLQRVGADNVKTMAGRNPARHREYGNRPIAFHQASAPTISGRPPASPGSHPDNRAGSSKEPHRSARQDKPGCRQEICGYPELPLRFRLWSADRDRWKPSANPRCKCDGPFP